MKTEKTAKEWFEQLPEPIRTQAIENTKHAQPYTGDNIFESLYSALFGGFNWDLTKQGEEYWNRIADRAYRGEFDTPNLHGWIPVSKRLPTTEDADEFGNVLILRETTEHQIETCKSIIKWDMLRHCNKETTMWQPLPKLPEVQNGNN